MTKIDIITGRGKYIQRIINLVPKSLRLKFNPRRYAIEKFVEKSACSLKSESTVLDAGAGPCPYKQFFRHCNYESTYDAVLNTEVLEHVEYPQKVIDEFYRILKKGGKLFLTTPQSWRIHQAPHNYFYFTYYGLKSLLKKAGFSKYKITPMGGYFWFLADALRFNNLLEQVKKNKILYYSLTIIGYPFTQIIFPLILFHMDSFDKKREWTMGYTVEAVK